MKTPKSETSILPSKDHAENEALRESHRLLESENDHTEQPEKHRTNNDFIKIELLLTKVCSLLETRVRNDADEREKADVDEEIKNDWMLAAAVIDRILLFTFSFLFIGGHFVFFIAFLLIS